MGHATGDRVLRDSAVAWRAVLRLAKSLGGDRVCPHIFHRAS